MFRLSFSSGRSLHDSHKVVAPRSIMWPQLGNVVRVAIRYITPAAPCRGSTLTSALVPSMPVDRWPSWRSSMSRTRFQHRRHPFLRHQPQGRRQSVGGLASGRVLVAVRIQKAPVERRLDLFHQLPEAPRIMVATGGLSRPRRHPRVEVVVGGGGQRRRRVPRAGAGGAVRLWLHVIPEPELHDVLPRPRAQVVDQPADAGGVPRQHALVVVEPVQRPRDRCPADRPRTRSATRQVSWSASSKQLRYGLGEQAVVQERRPDRLTVACARRISVGHPARTVRAMPSDSAAAAVRSSRKRP